MNVADLPEGTAAELFLRVNDSYTESETTSLNEGSAVVSRNLETAPLPPFASITYWWTYETPDGKVTETPRHSFQYSDDRFTWRKATADPVRIHWITGEHADMEQALDVAQVALGAIYAALQTPQIETVDIFVYPSQTDLASAMQLGGHRWAGGVAYPELQVILIAAPPSSDGLLTMQQFIPHELAHMALFNLLGSQGYAFLPTWLNEGLATYFETRPDPANAQAIRTARDTNDLIPLTELCVPFPEDPARAQLAYAQSGSLVHYLRQEYGWTAIRELLWAYADGQACNTGTETAIQQDLTQLEREWRFWLEQDGEMSAEEPSPARVAARLFLRDAGPWLMLVAALLIPATLVVATRRRG
ncbi:MAG: peptidase MA family metallohydrolase [Anaerolineae bacterium]|nr:peptidase MA family metallohydrolase [Anaerolineae bacterium]